MLAVIGTGIVSPAGLGPRMHAAVVRAGAVPVTASPFLGTDDRPVPAGYCAWLGARMDLGDRLLAMAEAALADALRAAAGAEIAGPIPLFVCAEPGRAGLSADALARVEGALGGMVRCDEPQRVKGAAGCFAAIGEAEALLAAGPRAVAVVAFDSHIAAEAMSHEVANPPSPWSREPPPPAEGAAAIVLVDLAEARRSGVEITGLVHYAGSLMGASNDDNDAIVDGSAMTELLRRMPSLRVPAPLVFGQSGTDPLRASEWDIAVARNPSRFHPEYEIGCVERSIGTVGAAAGLMNLVHGLATAALRASTPRTPAAFGEAITEVPVGDADPFLVWAISRDGTRGLAAVSAGQGAP